MMGRKNGSIALLRPHLLEEIVPQPAGGILDTEVFTGGITMGVELGHIDRHPITLRQLTDELLVAVAVVGAQMKIAMGDGKEEARGMHQMGEDHGIDTATNSKQHLLPRGEEMLLLNVRYKLT